MNKTLTSLTCSLQMLSVFVPCKMVTDAAPYNSPAQTSAMCVPVNSSVNHLCEHHRWL